MTTSPAAPAKGSFSGFFKREQLPELCKNAHVLRWMEQCIDLCQPSQLYWCNGSQQEKQSLLEQGTKDGVFIKLNQQKLPNCYFHRSNSNDVARTEHLTFICTPSQDMAGPTNNWMETRQAYNKLTPLFQGCMSGKGAASPAR